MEMTGQQSIPAPREKVWEALNDPEVLKVSIPGCQELTKTGDGGLEAKVKAKVGPVSATFIGKVELSNIDPPNGYTIVGEGKGGVAGFAKGGADVRLAEDGAATLLSYKVNAQVGGKLAQIGSRLIDGTAKKMAEQFFTKFSEVVAVEEAVTEAQTPTIAAEAAEAPTETQVADAHHGDDHHGDHSHPVEVSPELSDEVLNKDVGQGVRWGVWVVGLFVAALILLAIFGLGGEEPLYDAGQAEHSSETHNN